MKLDAELFNAILLKVEDEDPGMGIILEGNSQDAFIEGHDYEFVFGHLRVAIKSDLVTGRIEGGAGWLQANPVSLTMKGHEYLKALRTAGVVDRLKAMTEEKGADVVLDIAKQLAIHFATS